MRGLIIFFVPFLVLSEDVTTESNYFELSNDGLVIHYAHSINATVDNILANAGVTANSDVSELVKSLICKNITSQTMLHWLRALTDEIPSEYLTKYKRATIPRIYGLYQKMVTLGERLAAIYGFKGKSASSYAMLLRPMSIESILSSALKSAKNDNNSFQYEAIKTLANELGVENGNNFANGSV